jgi:hypothetical protein
MRCLTTLSMSQFAQRPLIRRWRAGVAKSAQQPATGWTAEIRVRYPEETGDISHFHNVHTGSGAHPISYIIVTGNKAAESVKLATHIHLVLRIRICGPIPPLFFILWHIDPLLGRNLEADTGTTAVAWYRPAITSKISGLSLENSP